MATPGESVTSWQRAADKHRISGEKKVHEVKLLLVSKLVGKGFEEQEAQALTNKALLGLTDKTCT